MWCWCVIKESWIVCYSLPLTLLFIRSDVTKAFRFEMRVGMRRVRFANSGQYNTHLNSNFSIWLVLIVVVMRYSSNYIWLLHTKLTGFLGKICHAPLLQTSEWISQNNYYKQHHTMDDLQKPVTCSKSLVHSSKVNLYVNEHVSAIRISRRCLVLSKCLVMSI